MTGSRSSTKNHRRKERVVSDEAAAQDRDSSVLDGLVESLRKKYTRPALRGRLEQVESTVVGLKHLIDQLADEEMREADHANRLLEIHDSGERVEGSDNRERLQAALAMRKEGSK
jgi:hypothetical protein